MNTSPHYIHIFVLKLKKTKMNDNFNHILQSGYFTKTLRDWQSTNTNITPSTLILPIFIHENDDCDEDIPSLPELKRFGVNKLNAYLQPIVNNGLRTVLLFGVIERKENKDANGTFADT